MTHSPRDFIFGDPVVRRESSSGGLAEDAMMDGWYRDETDQRRRISIETGSKAMRLGWSRGHIPCNPVRHLYRRRRVDRQRADQWMDPRGSGI